MVICFSQTWVEVWLALAIGHSGSVSLVADARHGVFPCEQLVEPTSLSETSDIGIAAAAVAVFVFFRVLPVAERLLANCWRLLAHRGQNSQVSHELFCLFVFCSFVSYEGRSGFESQKK